MPDRAKIHSPEFQARFEADVAKHLDRPFTLVLGSCADAIAIIGQIQLALRHPGNKGPTAKHARKMVQDMIDVLSATPTIRAGLESGFDPSCGAWIDPA